MQNRIELVVLKHLLNEEDYARRTLPYLKSEYFSEMNERVIYQEIDKYLSQYNSLPTKEALLIELDNNTKVSDENFTKCSSIVSELDADAETDKEWLIEKTEKFCQEKAIYNAIMESISIIDGKDKQDKGTIPELLSDALSVSFDPSIGHDFIDDSDSRWDFYHRVEERIPFDLDYLNKITKGGLPKKSLNIILAGTGVGKSLAMCHMASANLLDGKNVLYITMEMAEEKIAERIDANLLNIPIDQIENLSKDMFKDKVSQITAKTDGKLIIKEYPTGQANTSHFRALLNELKLKKNFIPEIIFVDYLNICASSRMKMIGGSINSYSYIKSIAEEMRGLAVEFNVPIMSATQTNRSGFTSDDPGLEDTSESFGLPATADLMFALISNEELNTMGKILVKQLKNRYNDPTKYNRFTLKIDRSKMRLSDDDNQNVVTNNDDTPVFDKSTSGERVSSEKFKDFKWE